MIEGIFPPIPTPFENGEVAYDKLRENISQWNETQISGYVVLGSNGESVYLTKDEKLNLIQSTKDSIAENKILIAGTGSDSIKETIVLSNEAAERGADAALVLTPSFFKSQMNHNAFLKFFNEVADSISIPIIIYNVPKFTGVEISHETVAELSEHKNIIGIKHSSENIGMLSNYIKNTTKDFSVLVGSASVFFTGLCVGAKGGILALANIAPNECVKIHTLYEEGKTDEARDLQFRLLNINYTITAKYGIAGLKAAMDLLGYYGGDPRSPLSPLSNSEKEEIRLTLSNAKLIR